MVIEQNEKENGNDKNKQQKDEDQITDGETESFNSNDKGINNLDDNEKDRAIHEDQEKEEQKNDLNQLLHNGVTAGVIIIIFLIIIILIRRETE